MKLKLNSETLFTTVFNVAKKPESLSKGTEGQIVTEIKRKKKLDFGKTESELEVSANN